MGIKHIAFTLYPVQDMARARKFYEQDLGLKVTKDFEGSWVEYHLENGAFALSSMVPQKSSLGHGGSIAFEVDDLEATLADLKAKGVKILKEDIESPVCRMAAIADPEGNALVVHQKKSA